VETVILDAAVMPPAWALPEEVILIGTTVVFEAVAVIWALLLFEALAAEVRMAPALVSEEVAVRDDVEKEPVSGGG
jgi:hypothetical protein